MPRRRRFSAPGPLGTAAAAAARSESGACGHDPQLEAAVRKAMEMLRAHPVPTYRLPPYPKHHPVLPPPGE